MKKLALTAAASLLLAGFSTLALAQSTPGGASRGGNCATDPRTGACFGAGDQQDNENQSNAGRGGTTGAVGAGGASGNVGTEGGAVGTGGGGGGRGN